MALESLAERLVRAGAIRSRAVEAAFRSVDPALLLPTELSALAGADAPLPYTVDPAAGVAPSPRVLAAMLEVLEVERGLRVAIVGGGAYPALLVRGIAGDAPLLLVESESAVRERTSMLLQDHRQVDLVVQAEGEWDRIWFPHATPARGATDRNLADLGFIVAPTETPRGPALLKRIRSGEECVDLTTHSLPEEPGRPAFDVTRALALDALMVRAWLGTKSEHLDEHFATSVAETIEGGPLDSQSAPDTVQKAGARKAFHIALILQSGGELSRAEDLYRRSIDLFPSAEAYTFLGWTQSFQRRYEEAIDACHRAIEVDPTFGNPFNDIGAYLLELERPAEAIPWLEKATSAPRYCCPFYAYTNLARAHLILGRQQQARRHLIEALRVNPDYEPAREMLRRIDPAFDYFA